MNLISITFICFILIYPKTLLSKQSCLFDIKKAPPCPSTGTILSPTYPVAFATVSLGNNINYAKEFISSAVFAQDPPVRIIITGTSEQFESLKNKLDEKYHKYLQPIILKSEKEAKNTVWQKDFIIPQFNSESGTPILLGVKDYFKSPKYTPFVKLNKIINKFIGKWPNETEYFNQIKEKAETTIGNCLDGINSNKKFLEFIKMPGYECHKPLSSIFGGNIESLPNGQCLIGNSLEEVKQRSIEEGKDCQKTDDTSDDKEGKEYKNAYAKIACGSSKFIEAPTHLMKVGHIDEIMSIIPDPKKRHPCNYKIAVASPRLATELLSQKSKNLLIEKVKSSSLIQMTSDNLNDQSIYSQLNELCSDINEKKLMMGLGDQENTIPFQKNKGKTKNISLLYFFELFHLIKYSNLTFANNNSNKEICTNLTHQDLINFIKNNDPTNNIRSIVSEIKSVNDTFQEEMNHFVEKTLKKADPLCKPEIIEIPVLFKGILKNEGSKIYVDNLESLFPNPLNTVSIGNHIIYSKSGIQTFDKDVEDKFKPMESHGVNTYLENSDGGNIHCLTNVIRYCNPKIKD